MKKIKKIIVVFLALLMIIPPVQAAGMGIQSGASGKLTKTISYSLNYVGELTIKGTGDIPNFYYGDEDSGLYGGSPFSGSTDIEKVIIENGITGLGMEMFGGCRNLTSVTIPSSVTKIVDGAFEYCTALTSITIPNSVTEIGNYVFSGCSNLKSVTLPNGLLEIGYDCFENCPSLTGLTIPNSVTTIGSGAFYNCTGIKSITIPGSVTTIESYAFQNCTGLSSITIPDNVTSLDGGVFSGCSSLIGVKLSKNITNIGDGLFGNCRSLVALEIPDGVTSIGNNAFNGCIGLMGVVIPDTVTSIGNNAFNGCTKLASLTIPDDVTSIGSGAFCNCKALTSITIPDGVTSIGDNTFNGCTGLTSITIPASVKTVGANAFSGCSNLASVTFEKNVESIGNDVFSNCKSSLKITVNDCSDISAIKNAAGGNYEYSQPDHPSYADGKCTACGYICKHNGIDEGNCEICGLDIFEITSYGVLSKYNGIGIETVTIPSNVIGIGSNVFKGKTDIKNVLIPNGVTTISDNAFENCTALTNVTVPSTLVFFGIDVFTGCSSLSKISVRSCREITSLKEKIDAYGDFEYEYLGDHNYDEITGECVRCGFVCSHNGILSGICEICGKEINPGFIIDENGVLTGYTGEGGTICLPEVVTEIKDNAFEGNNNILEITIPGNVKTIGSSAFKYCSGLYKVTMLEGVENIRSQAFYYCQRLRTVVFPESIKNLEEDYIFCGCSSLTKVTLPEGIKDLGNSLFFLCSELREVNLPDSLETIGYSAFSNDPNIKSITIPGSVKLIKSGAFYNCSSLESINFYTDTVEFEDSVFSGLPKNAKFYCACNLDLESLQSKITAANFKGTGEYLPHRYENGVCTVCGLVCEHSFSNGVCTICGVEEFVINSDGVLTKYYGKSADVVIPDGVTAIGAEAFKSNKYIKNVTIPDSVTSIGESAFYGCSALTSIVIPDGVTAIAGGTFDGCSSLASLTIPDSVTSIGTQAFLNCTGLTEITIPGGVTSIGDRAFEGCTSLSKVYSCNTDRIKSMMRNYGTYQYFKLDHKIVDDVCTVCDFHIFEINSDGVLTKYNGKSADVIIPDGVTAIGDGAFRKNTYIKNVTIPDGVASIGHYAFESSSIESITIPDSVTIIDDYAFNESAIKSITIPGSVTTIDKQAFYGCTNLTDVIISDGVTSIGDEAFSGSAIESITIPGSVASIGAEAFYDCKSLKTVTISYGVKRIDNNAFRGSAIENITIPDSVTSIGGYAFYSCYSLINITIPDSVTSIGSYVFGYCSRLTNATIPDSVTSMGGYVFYNCSRLKNVTIPKGITSISQYTFSGCTDLAHITIPDSVKTIEDSAFRSCSSLTELTIPDSVNCIDGNAFIYCKGLKSVTLPDSVIFQNKSQFTGCTSLKTVYYDCDDDVSVIQTAMSTFGTYTYIPIHNMIDGTCTICGSDIMDDLNNRNYVIHDITNDLFLTGGDEWGTQLVGDIHGKFMSFTAVDGGYALATGFDNGNNSQYLSEAGWCDGSLNDAIKFTFIPSENGYYIKKTDSDLYLTKGDIPSGFTKPVYSFVQTDTPTEWKLISREDIIARSGDFTPLIADANMSRNDTGFADWSGTNSISKVPQIWDSGTNLYNTFIEFFSEAGGGSFNTYQTITGIPNGKYILKAQGFYRCGTFEEAETGYANGTGDEIVTYLYASSGTVEERTKLKSIASESFYIDGINDDQLRALAAFTAGEYQNELEIEVTDGTLTFGVKSDGYINPIGWATFDNFELYYIPSQEPISEEPFTDEADFEILETENGAKIISGFNPGDTTAALDKYIADGWDVSIKTADGTERIGTGSVITLTSLKGDTMEYTVVIYGDADGDAWYDAPDSLVVNCLVNGLLSRAQVGEAVWYAADCNHDGVINADDVALLEQAGLLLAEIDQTKSGSSLTEDSVFVEYLNLISQKMATKEAPAEEPTAEEPADEPVVTKTLIQKIIDFIIYIFKMITAYIPKVF